VQSAVPELQRTVRADDDGSDASPASFTEKDQSGADVDDDGTLPDEITAEELSKYALSAKRRIRKLGAQRHGLRVEVQRLQALIPQAQVADSVSTFLRDNNISRDDFLLGLKVMGALGTGDIPTARALIEPYWNMIEQYSGNQLPPDLQNAVRQGQMTTEAAVHFSRERMQRALLENKHRQTQQVAAQQQQFFQQQQELQRRKVLADEIRDAANEWERRVAAHDPDYEKKRNAVHTTMWAVVKEKGSPESPEHAIQIAREAYRRANEQYRSWTSPKRPTSRSPSSTGRTTGAAPEPKTMLEVVRQARESARASL